MPAMVDQHAVDVVMLCNGGEPHPLAVSCVTGDQKAFC
jgi:hypothetical protein